MQIINLYPKNRKASQRLVYIIFFNFVLNSSSLSASDEFQLSTPKDLELNLTCDGTRPCLHGN